MHIIAADVGGTKTQFILADTHDPENSLFEARYSSTDFAGFSPLLETFISDSGLQHASIDILVLALPGLVTEKLAQLTNLPWTIEKQQILQDFHVKKVYFMNDFQASAYGACQLKEAERVLLHQGKTGAAMLDDNAVSVAIGAGTGLGMSWIIGDRQSARAYATEGGHIDFAPIDDTQHRLLRFLQQRYRHVSYERILSGEGLVNLYEFCVADADAPRTSQTVSAAWINSQAENDSLAGRAVSLFVHIYGAYAGNIALLFKPYRGIYITGGIAAKMVTKMQSEAFNIAFLDKGRMRSLVEQVSVYLVTNERVGALGAMLQTINIHQEQQ